MVTRKAAKRSARPAKSSKRRVTVVKRAVDDAKRDITGAGKALQGHRRRAAAEVEKLIKLTGTDQKSKGKLKAGLRRIKRHLKAMDFFDP
jgi:DUF917 family protein